LCVLVVASGLGAAVTLTAQRPSFSPGFAVLLQQYIQGDTEPVIAELASWPDDRLDAEAGAPPPSGSTWDLAAYAALHAEAALEAGYRNRDWIAEGALRDLIPSCTHRSVARRAPRWSTSRRRQAAASSTAAATVSLRSCGHGLPISDRATC
jgi:hypothetical protein